jgi:hypothetical protein
LINALCACGLALSPKKLSKVDKYEGHLGSYLAAELVRRYPQFRLSSDIYPAEEPTSEKSQCIENTAY